MYGDSVKPLKSTGTRSIYLRIRAMRGLVGELGLYTRHLKEIIDHNKNSKVRATVKAKLVKLLDSQVFLSSAFQKDLLATAKNFSLVTHKQDSNVVETVEAIKNTRRDYKKLLKKNQRDQNSVFQLSKQR